MMPEAGPDASVEYADWLYETEQAIGGLSDRSALWFSACLSVARRTYREYVNASPITRLTLEVNIPAELKAERWSRLERRTMTLLLNAMPRTMKDDAITHRIASAPSLLYRMFVIYQPGGASERASILKHLEGASAGDNIHDTIQALRRWRRYLQRAEEMGIAAPDASILLRSVELRSSQRPWRPMRTFDSGCLWLRTNFSFRVARPKKASSSTTAMPWPSSSRWRQRGQQGHR